MSAHPFDDALAAYALDALDRDEAAFVERHLVECAACAEEVAAMREATAMLATSVPQVAPPPALRARVLERALGQAPGAQAAATAAAVRAVHERVEPRDVREVRSVSDIRDARRSRGALIPWLLAAACAMLAVGLGTTLQRERAERTALLADIARTDSLLADQTLAVAVRDSLLARVLGPEVETTTLAATGAVPSLRLFRDRSRGLLIVSARRLPPAPDGRTYQLWGIGADGQPIGLGLFNTADNGEAVVTLEVAGDTQFSVSAVTDEPAGGSPQPTSTPFLVGSWPAAE